MLTGHEERPFLYILVITCIGISLGLVWEIVEWIYDLVNIGGNVIKGKTDTLLDLIMDGLGAAGAGYLTVKILKVGSARK